MTAATSELGDTTSRLDDMQSGLDDMQSALDVLVIGRCGIDLYPTRGGVPLDEIDTFGKFLGGSAANVAVAAARLGRAVALISGVGADPFGRYVRRQLRALGVDDRYVGTCPDLPTPVTFCEIFPPDDFPIYFYRRPSAPDLQVDAGDIDSEAVRSARLFWATATGLCEEPSRSAHFAAWRARGRAPMTVLDLDYRAQFWESTEAAGTQLRRALPQVTVAVGNRAECEVAVGETDPLAAAEALLDFGLELAVVKLGPDGALARTRSETVVIPAFSVPVVNGLGAGDGFGGSLCNGLLAGWPVAEILRYANAAGALVAGKLECSTAMPTWAEITALADRTEAARARP